MRVTDHQLHAYTSERRHFDVFAHSPGRHCLRMRTFEPSRFYYVITFKGLRHLYHVI